MTETDKVIEKAVETGTEVVGETVKRFSAKEIIVGGAVVAVGGLTIFGAKKLIDNVKAKRNSKEKIIQSNPNVVGAEKLEDTTEEE